MNTNRHLPLLAAVATVCANGPVARAALYTFDTEASMAGLSTPLFATRSDTGGISGGSLQPTYVSSAYTLNPDAGLPVVGKSYTVSASFHVVSSSLARHAVGLFDSSGRNLGSFYQWDGGAPLGLTYYGGFGADMPFSVESFHGVPLAGTMLTPSGPTWINVSLEATYLGPSPSGSNWQYEARIDDLGALGTAPPVTLYASGTVDLTVAAPPPVSGIHGGYFTYGPVGAPAVVTDRIDNFLVVPEPSAALLVCAAGGALVRRRR